ncbi:Ribosomal RNA large subunit methyltransferase E [Candidatus Magnetomoraceae bacterium gMMP-1]
MKSKGNKWADHYTKQAQKDGFPARSVYKLKEIQKKFKLIKKGNRVLDLGCAPGSWLLYILELVKKSGYVVGIDLKHAKLPSHPHVKTITGDILDSEKIFAELNGKFDVILSDMAPVTTGRKDVDAFRSLELCNAAFLLAEKLLRPGGSFVCKIFQGEGFKDFSNKVKKCYKQHRIFKPKSSRKASREIYIIGLEKKQEKNHVRS